MREVQEVNLTLLLSSLAGLVGTQLWLIDQCLSHNVLGIVGSSIAMAGCLILCIWGGANYRH